MSLPPPVSTLTSRTENALRRLIGADQVSPPSVEVTIIPPASGKTSKGSPIPKYRTFEVLPKATERPPVGKSFSFLGTQVGLFCRKFVVSQKPPPGVSK